jgi:hypothetical protein
MKIGVKFKHWGRAAAATNAAVFASQSGWSDLHEKGVRSAQKMQVGRRIPAEMQL